MSKLTRQYLANKTAESWRKNYFFRNSWKDVVREGGFCTSELIYNELVQLGKTLVQIK